jgi:hypothetical protein
MPRRVGARTALVEGASAGFVGLRRRGLRADRRDLNCRALCRPPIQHEHRHSTHALRVARSIAHARFEQANAAAQIRPLEYPKPPAGSLVLFDGSGVDAWQQRDGNPAAWQIVDGVLEVAADSGDLITREPFEDVRLHVEFRLPATSDPDARADSGVVLQARYEVQILDAFGRALEGSDDAAAISGVRAASLNEALPPETWQSYDIVFRSARWAGATKTQPARLSVVWNGSLVHDAVELPGSTSAGEPESPAAGPLLLQGHGQGVRYRNVWLQRL